MKQSVTMRFRCTPEYRDELQQLQEWVAAETLTDVLRMGVKALKERSGFDDRDTDLDAAAKPGPPAFTPGAGLKLEGTNGT